MRALVFIVSLCLPTVPACAINWDGHDDWLTDIPAALELERSFDDSAAPPSSLSRRHGGCQPLSSVGTVLPNPYEPVLPLCREDEEPENSNGN